MITVAIAKHICECFDTIYCINMGPALSTPEDFKRYVNSFTHFILVHINIYSYADILYNKISSYIEEDD